MLDDAHQVARTILTAHRTVLDTVASELIATETLEVDEVVRLLGPVPKWRTEANGEARVAGRGQSAAAVADAPEPDVPDAVVQLRPFAAAHAHHLDLVGVADDRHA